MFGIEKDFQKLMEQAYGPLGEKNQMTEIEEIKAQLNVLQSKLSFLEELEKTKSPAEEAYKRVYSNYPKSEAVWNIFQEGYEAATQDYKVGEYQETAQELSQTKSPAEEAYRRWWGEYPSDDNGWEIDNTRWRGFRVGYNYAQKDYKVGEYQEPHAIRETVKEKWDAVRESMKPQTPIPQMELLKYGRVFCVDYNNTIYYRQEYHDSNGWIKWWRQDDEDTSILTRVDDAETFRLENVFSADLAANPDGSFKFLFGPKLYDVILEWWDDIFSVNSNDDSNTSVRDLVTRIEEWLPKSQSAEGSQSIGVEELVQGFNDCLNKIKSKLR